MTIVYMIRHSNKLSSDYYLNKEDADSYIRDKSRILSIEGEERSKILSQEKELQNIDAVYTSTMVRTQSTAKYLCAAQNLKMYVDERLNEKKTGIVNPDLKDWYIIQYKDKTFKNINGESQEDVFSRVNEAMNEILNKNKNKRIAVFSHGYAITYYLLHFCKLIDVNNDRKLTIEFNGKIFMDKILNAPEVFKLIYDENNNLIDVSIIEFKDLPYLHGGI